MIALGGLTTEQAEKVMADPEAIILAALADPDEADEGELGFAAAIITIAKLVASGLDQGVAIDLFATRDFAVRIVSDNGGETYVLDVEFLDDEEDDES